MCPNASTTSWATNTSPHTLQCLPSVKPVCVHVASTAASITSVWPNAATVTVSRLNSSPHSVQYTTLSYDPVNVHVGSTLFSTTTLPSVWPKASTVTVSRLNSSPQTVQYTTLSYDPVNVQVGSTLFSTTTLPSVWPKAST